MINTDFDVVTDHTPKTPMNDFATYIKEIVKPRGGHLYTYELQQHFLNWRKWVRDMSNVSWEQQKESLKDKR